MTYDYEDLVALALGLLLAMAITILLVHGLS